MWMFLIISNIEIICTINSFIFFIGIFLILFGSDCMEKKRFVVVGKYVFFFFWINFCSIKRCVDSRSFWTRKPNIRSITFFFYISWTFWWSTNLFVAFFMTSYPLSFTNKSVFIGCHFHLQISLHVNKNI